MDYCYQWTDDVELRLAASLRVLNVRSDDCSPAALTFKTPTIDTYLAENTVQHAGVMKRRRLVAGVRTASMIPDANYRWSAITR